MANNNYESKSVSSATGSSQTIAAENLARRELFVYNIAATDWTLNLIGGTAAAGAADCVTLKPGDAITINGTNKITAIGTAASKLTVEQR
jgi:hypothetical protein